MEMQKTGDRRSNVRASAVETLRHFDRQADSDRDIPADATSAVREIVSGILAIDPVKDIHGLFSAVEDFAYGAPGIAHAVLPTIQGAVLVGRCGSEGQRVRFLARAANTGRNIALLLLTEDSGRGASEWCTHAKRAEDKWVINGQKSGVNNNGHEFAIIAAKDGTGGIGLFSIEDSHLFGAEGGNREFPTMALGASCLSEVAIDNIVVDDHDRLARSSSVDAIRAVAQSRLLVGAISLGTANASLDYARQWVTKRMAFGKPLAAFEGVAFDVADSDIKLQAAHFMLHHVLDELESIDDIDAIDDKVGRALVRVKAVAAAVAIDGVQLMGVHGIIHEHPQELFHRTASSLAVLDSDPLMSGYALL